MPFEVCSTDSGLSYTHKDYRPGVIDFAEAGIHIESSNTYGVSMRAVGRDGDTIDLSAEGTANCYIVNGEGRYKFKTARGNNAQFVEEVASVDVLWESFGTTDAPATGDLIKDVSCADGYITFVASDIKGNAVIAARKSSGWIIWSWHIWLTDEPEEVKLANGAGVIMDRNLGATTAAPGQVTSLGLLYQWGRKDPFLGSGSIRKNVRAASTFEWPKPVKSLPQYGNMAYASSHPTTFIFGNENLDWYFELNVTDDPMWFGSKTMYDPCPLGYRVPEGGKTGVWSTARKHSAGYKNASNWKSDKRGVMLTNLNEDKQQEAFYPAAGYLDNEKGDLLGVGEYGLYWSSSMPKNGLRSYMLTIDSQGYVNPAEVGWRASANSVRCVKE